MKLKPRHAVVAVIAVIVGWWAFKNVPAPLPELSRTEFLVEVRAGHIHEIVIEDRQVITGESSTRGRFRTRYEEREDTNFLADLRAQGVDVLFDNPTGLTP
jgi:hypothetical protein